MESMAELIGLEFECDTCQEKYLLKDLANHKASKHSIPPTVEVKPEQLESEEESRNEPIIERTVTVRRFVIRRSSQRNWRQSAIRRVVQEMLGRRLTHLTMDAYQRIMEGEETVARTSETREIYISRMGRVLRAAGYDVNSAAQMIQDIRNRF